MSTDSPYSAYHVLRHFDYSKSLESQLGFDDETEANTTPDPQNSKSSTKTENSTHNDFHNPKNQKFLLDSAEFDHYSTLHNLYKPFCHGPSALLPLPSTSPLYFDPTLVSQQKNSEKSSKLKPSPSSSSSQPDSQSSNQSNQSTPSNYITSDQLHSYSELLSSQKSLSKSQKQEKKLRNTYQPSRFSCWSRFMHIIRQPWRHQCDIYIPNSHISSTYGFSRQTLHNSNSTTTTTTTATAHSSDITHPKSSTNDQTRQQELQNPQQHHHHQQQQSLPPLPVAFYVHGGGFQRGGKNEMWRSAPVMSEAFVTCGSRQQQQQDNTDFNSTSSVSKYDDDGAKIQTNFLKKKGQKLVIGPVVRNQDGNLINHTKETLKEYENQTRLENISKSTSKSNSKNVEEKNAQNDVIDDNDCAAVDDIVHHIDDINGFSIDVHTNNHKHQQQSNPNHSSSSTQPLPNTPYHNNPHLQNHIVVTMNYSLSSASFLHRIFLILVLGLVLSILTLTLSNIIMGFVYLGLKYTHPSNTFVTDPQYWFKWINIWTLIGIFGIQVVIHFIFHFFTPRYQHPQHTLDVLQCIQWCDENLHKITPHADLSRSLIAGHSAGASIVACLITSHYSSLAQLRRTKIQRVITVSGLYNYITPSSRRLINFGWWLMYTSGSIGYLPHYITTCSSLYMLKEWAQSGNRNNNLIANNNNNNNNNHNNNHNNNLVTNNNNGNNSNNRVNENHPLLSHQSTPLSTTTTISTTSPQLHSTAHLPSLHWMVINASDDLGLEHGGHEFFKALHEYLLPESFALTMNGSSLSSSIRQTDSNSSTTRTTPGGSKLILSSFESNHPDISTHIEPLHYSDNKMMKKMESKRQNSPKNATNQQNLNQVLETRQIFDNMNGKFYIYYSGIPFTTHATVVNRVYHPNHPIRERMEEFIERSCILANGGGIDCNSNSIIAENQ